MLEAAPVPNGSRAGGQKKTMTRSHVTMLWKEEERQTQTGSGQGTCEGCALTAGSEGSMTTAGGGGSWGVGLPGAPSGHTGWTEGPRAGREEPRGATGR